MPLIVGSIFIQFFGGGLQKPHLFCNRPRVRIGRSGSSMILITIESAYATSY